MKLNHLKFFVALSLTLIFGCSSKEEQKPEVRFVDLQGNARSIKTRVPEANAKIMSGQSYNYNSQQGNPEIYNEYLENKKSLAGTTSPKDKDLIAQKNNFTPKFTDSDTYVKNPQVPQSKFENNKIVETENQNVAENNEPVVEYDLSKEDDSSNKTANKNNLTQKESLGQENESSIVKKRDRTNKNNLNTNETAEYSEEDVDESKSNKLLKKSPKFITYSSKKNGLKTPQPNITEDESQEPQTQYIGKSGGKVYVQVGSFLTSSGAKQRLLKSKELGKGKVLVAYNKQNKRIYRSVYGPFKSKNLALKFRDKVIDSGNEAIIIISK